MNSMLGKQRICAIIGILILLCGLSACGTKQETSTEPTPVDETPVRQEMRVVSFNGYDAKEDITETIVAETPSWGDREEEGVVNLVQSYNDVVVFGYYNQEMIINDIVVTPSESNTQYNVWVDFDKASVDAMELDTDIEGQLFGNLARGIDENLGNVHLIYFTMDGGNDFRTGHLWFQKDQPFWDSTNATYQE